MSNIINEKFDKYLGCLIGGAAGDALGYAVEFNDVESIFSKFGEKGITEYKKTDGLALISDDTQMTLFTANGLLLTDTIKELIGTEADYKELIVACYLDWLKTQESYGESGSFSWLNNIGSLNEPRAPGGTCISALYAGGLGSMENPINDSKGCGGVMRVAPIGLYFDKDAMSIDDVAMLGAKAAASTHGNPLGYISAAMLVHIINSIVHYELRLMDAINNAKTAIDRLFDDKSEAAQMNSLVDKAIALASRGDITDLDAIGILGEGWVAEETLAIAIYCSLKYENDFEKAVIAAVNHDGDSDSTGAVTGNILGAYLGFSKIPKKFTEDLECIDVITEIAEDLYFKTPDKESGRFTTWLKKYVYHDYTL